MTLNNRYDKRLIERNIRKGRVSKEEYQAHLDGLADLTDAMVMLDIPMRSEEERPADGVKAAPEEKAAALEAEVEVKAVKKKTKKKVVKKKTKKKVVKKKAKKKTTTKAAAKD